jgi:capsular exopolysaccharide synthesis family protein
MEKIKKALERASDSRGNTPAKNALAKDVLAKNAHRGKSKQSKKVAIPEITYAHTKKISIDEGHLRKNCILTGENNDHVSDAYKVLRTHVLQRMRKNNWNSLAITSPTGGDGKTVTAINLAISLAKEVNQTVLLVDFDLRQPKIGKYFSSLDLPGVSDYLAGNMLIPEILFNPGIDRLVVLPGNKSYNNSSEMLSSPEMVSLVQELKEYYTSRIIIFDLPPVLACDDVLAFSPYIDAIILVTEDGKTKKDELKRAFQLMDRDKLIGTVLNKSYEVSSAYSYS